MKRFTSLLFGVIFSFFLLGKTYAQNDLSIAYDIAGVPNKLNICGQPDTVKVLVSLAGISPNIRESIVASVNLADGIRIESFLVTESSAGVSLSNGTGTNMGQFALPNIDPNDLTEVTIAFLVKADCSINDLLAADPTYDLMDEWTLNYEINGTGVTPIVTTLNSYRAALRIPDFVINPTVNNQKLKAGDCITRQVFITNTSLDAHTTNMTYIVTTSNSLSYKAIRVNGIDAPLTKTVAPNGDTLVTIDLIGAHFVNNTGAGANNDLLFDANEDLIIEEDLCIVNCQTAFNTTHTASYGCFGTTCSQFSKDANLEQGQGNVSITFDIEKQINIGYCKTGVSAVKIKNSGVAIDPGFADIYNIKPGIAMGNPLSMSSNGYTINNLTIQGITLNNLDIKKTLDGNAAFTVDPDGIGGLSDLDGDGYFDDLAAGDSIIIEVEYDLNCGASVLDLSTNCDTSFVTHLSALLDYDDPCNMPQQEAKLNYLTVTNVAMDVEDYTTPDVEAGTGDIFYLKHIQNRIFFNFDQGCTNGNYYVQMVLPQGITLDAANTTLKRPFIDHPLVSSSLSNDTLTIKFAPSPIESMLGEYELSLAFTADCTAQDGEVNMVGEFGYMCDDCACKHIWYCTNMTGTYIHVNNPPCPTAPTCDNGIKAKSMDMSRTTFGFTDATYTTPIDPLTANTKSALNCDTMKMTVTGIAGSAFAGNNVGIDMSYANPLYELGMEDVFIYGRGYLEIKSGATTTTCEIPKTSLTTVTTADPYKYLDFNLEASLQGCGMTIQADDEVTGHLYFAVNGEGPILNQFYLVPELKAGFYVNQAAKITCGTYGDQVRVARNTALVTSPNNSDLPSGCDTAFLQFKVIPVFNLYDEEFVNEHRPAVGIDSITIDYDALRLNNGFSDLTVQARFYDHPILGNNFYAIGQLDNSGHFTASFDTLSLLPSLHNIKTAAFTLRIVAVPKCESLTGGGGGSKPLNHYPFQAKIHYKANYHVFNINNGACLVDSIFSNNNDIVYTDPPEISLENLGSPITQASGDIFKWTVRHCNTTSYADANVSWLSIEDISVPINILKMEDITDVGNIIDLPIINDGTGGFYANTNGLLRASVGNTTDDICNIIVITGQLTDCGEVEAKIRSGWNCSAFDQTQHNYCPETELTVRARSVEPLLSIIQTSGFTATSFCTNIPVELEIKNTQLGIYQNMTVEFTLPPDLDIVPGSFQIAWPKSAGFQPLGSEPTYVSSTIYGDIYSFTPFTPYPALVANGLNEVNLTMPNDSNEIVIQYELLSDCGYTSGLSSQINIYGQEFCGTSTDTTGFTTFPFFITGSELDPAHTIKIDPTLPDTIISQFPVAITITNQGSATTGTNDKIRVLLPAGISYTPNSATSTGWTVGEPTITINNGITTVEWDLPQGLTTNMTESFNFQLNADAIGCASLDFPIAFIGILETQELCVATGNNCTVDVITSPLDPYDIHKKGSPTVTIAASVSPTQCAGQSVQLIAEGFDDITWTTLPSDNIIGIGNPIMYTPVLTETSIIATATGDPCPVSSDTLSITVLESPMVVLPMDTTIFTGESVLINGILNTNIPTTLTWTPTTDLNDPTIINPIASPSTTTTYAIEALGDNGCSDLDTIVITITPKIDTVPCPILDISTDNANYMVVCGLEASFPLNIEYTNLSNYHILLNGTQSNNLVAPNLDSIGIYNISGFNATTGPYDIEWNFNNQDYQATVNDINALLTQLTTWDKFGNWYYDNNEEKLWGGAIFHDYGTLTISNTTGFDLSIPFEKTANYGQSQLAIGMGEYELIIFDTVNVCADTINLIVSCEDYNPNTPKTCITETIFINQEMEFCLTEYFPGKIENVSDICNNPDATSVEYTYNDSTFCLEYIGVELGSDSSCLVVCDEFGLCDTFNFCTEVVPYEGLPTANNDSMCVYMNTPQVFDILANDTTWGGIDTLYFVNTPLNGTITLNMDYTITYSPYDDVCERSEQIQYIVCNDNGCAEAFAEICVLCDDIIVFTAVSPNDDGANDVFYIANIENYPNNVVEVYNRWGNRIYRSIGYTNDWEGNWVNEKGVPDGTYFYVIKLNDIEKRVFKGHLEIRR